MRIATSTLTAVLFHSTAAVAYCPEYPTIEQEFKTSEFVFIGEVRSTQKVHPGSDDFFDGINYVVKVSERLRGTPGNTVTLFSENSSGRFPMQIGAKYLVFTSLQAGTFAKAPVYTVSYCGHSGTLHSRPKTLSAIRHLQKSKGLP